MIAAVDFRFDDQGRNEPRLGCWWVSGVKQYIHSQYLYSCSKIRNLTVANIRIDFLD